MNEKDLDFIVDSLLLAIDAGDMDGLQIMFDWGMEMVDGSPQDLIDSVQAPMHKRGKQQAFAVLESYAAKLSK